MKRGALAALLIPLALFGLLLGFVVIIGGAQQQAAAACGTGGAPVQVVVDAAGLPLSVGAYSGAQLVGAAAIIKAGADHGVPARGQTIGVMVSMGESALTAVDHGDAVGPDSLGWFQQRDPWGPREVRLDAYGSATMFFTGGQGGQNGLLDIPGWESMTPTAAAHAVQRNADPLYYTRYWDAAVAVVSALAGVQVDVVPGAGNQVCTDQAAGSIPVGSGGWVVPTIGRLSSGFSLRTNPVTGLAENHKGQDIAAPCDTPIYAAAAGTVIRSGPATGFGNAIYLDHGLDPLTGKRVVTIYGHEYNDGLLVTTGQQVTAGQQIGKVGSNGQSTGCHDHFQIELDGVAVDPLPFMAAHGAPLG